MSKFIHEENLNLFRKRQMLLKLLAEEEAKDEQPRLGQTPSGDRRPHQS
jgi:hypothetical protein